MNTIAWILAGVLIVTSIIGLIRCYINWEVNGR
jgi:hypothetical protein